MVPGHGPLIAMPELPEVETTRRGIRPYVEGQRVTGVRIRCRQLRWPIPAGIEARLTGAAIESVQRRAKYLLLHTGRGTALIHLGMSGSLRLCKPGAAYEKHDHYEFVLENGWRLRYRDPRRFGCLLWAGCDPAVHPLLKDLGPEPFDAAFSGDYLYEVSRHRRVSIKAQLMNARIVAGVGNIYANEALFLAGIHPRRAAGRISRARMQRLTDAVRDVLQQSIRAGGTTLRDFLGGDGQPGYFRQQLRVYDRAGQPCDRCGTPLRHTMLGQRATCYCARCQT